MDDSRLVRQKNWSLEPDWVMIVTMIVAVASGFVFDLGWWSIALLSTVTFLVLAGVLKLVRSRSMPQ